MDSLVFSMMVEYVQTAGYSISLKFKEIGPWLLTFFLTGHS